jgi:CRISPR-associated endoribonuclease Cas6
LRIILKLKAEDEFNPHFEYHHQVQRFIYSLLKTTSFESLHDNRGYKFFSFSNIFSSTRKDEKGSFNLIISSPMLSFIEQISYQLKKLTQNQIPIEIGKTLFELQTLRYVSYKNLQFPLRVITGTPILVRIPAEKFMSESTAPTTYRSIYWQNKYSVELFVNAIESNLKKKYKDFTNLEFSSRFLEEFKFKKQVSTSIQLYSSKITVIGSLWEFTFSENIDKNAQLFALDCGMGERNSLGFGFLNPIHYQQ